MNRINKKRLLCALLTGALALPAVAWAQGQARPKPKAPAKVEEPQEEYTEEEYDAYEKAKGETDIDKRQTALIAFLEKYPQSKLKPYIVSEYQILFFEYQKKKDFEKLAAAAERWLKFAPNDLTAIAFIADAAEKLGQDRKFIEYAQKIYAQKPTGDMALMLAQSCRKLGEEAKYLEWVEKTLSDPKYADRLDLRLARMELVDKCSKEKNFAKAAEHAQLVLKALETTKKPDTTSEGDWRKTTTGIKRACHYIIADNLYDKDKFSEAIQSLERSLAVDPKFDWAHYYIGLSLWRLKKVENNEAPLAFAKAVLLKGEAAPQAKEHLEKIYKALHNDNLTGIEKLYSTAEKELNSQRSAQTSN